MVGKPRVWRAIGLKLNAAIATAHIADRVVAKIEHVPDEETELYFKAADVLILPYTHVFQSGVLFLGYSFGLPAIAADVGSLREEIIEGETGFVFKPRDSSDLARKIQNYFNSELFRNLGNPARRRLKPTPTSSIRGPTLATIVTNVYSSLLLSALSIMAPLVSILIPAYNAERWIADTIRSRWHRPWRRKKVIIVDDGSRDRTLSIARHSLQDRVFVVTQENQERRRRETELLSFVGGSIQWLDADDLVAPDKIARANGSGRTG